MNVREKKVVSIIVGAVVQLLVVLFLVLSCNEFDADEINDILRTVLLINGGLGVSELVKRS